MPTNIFKSAVIKLTVWYVGALLLVCMLFSFPMYNIAASRLQHGAEQQTDVVRRLPSNPYLNSSLYRELEERRNKQLAEDRHQLIGSLVFINLIIVASGAVASFLFARYTLRPIEESHQAQEKFTANASHELRTPLAVMQTEIEVALRNKKLSDKDAREILASNLEEVSRLRQLSDQLLGLTRNGTKLNLKKVKLNGLISSEVKNLSKRYKIKIQADLKPDTVVLADAALFRQVIDILVDNAVKYSDKKDPNVNVKLAKSNGNIKLVVSDNGKGIAPTELPNIFERFYRGSIANQSNPEGHGLGLSLAKEIIEKHGGTISAQSKQGKGSSFSISL